MAEKAGGGSCKSTLGSLQMMGLTLPGGNACTPVQFQPFLLGKSLLTPKGEEIRRKNLKQVKELHCFRSSIPFCREVALWGGHYLTWAKGDEEDAELAVLTGSGCCGGISFHHPRGPFLPGVPKKPPWPPSPFSPPSLSTSTTVCTGRVAQNSAHPRSVLTWTCRNGIHQGFSEALIHLLPPAPLSFSTKVERDHFSLISLFESLQKLCVCFSKSQNHSQSQSFK